MNEWTRHKFRLLFSGARTRDSCLRGSHTIHSATNAQCFALPNTRVYKWGSSELFQFLGPYREKGIYDDSHLASLFQVPQPYISSYSFIFSSYFLTKSHRRRGGMHSPNPELPTGAQDYKFFKVSKTIPPNMTRHQWEGRGMYSRISKSGPGLAKKGGRGLRKYMKHVKSWNLKKIFIPKTHNIF